MNDTSEFCHFINDTSNFFYFFYFFIFVIINGIFILLSDLQLYYKKNANFRLPPNSRHFPTKIPTKHLQSELPTKFLLTGNW